LQEKKSDKKEFKKLKQYNRSEPRLETLFKTIQTQFPTYSLTDKLNFIHVLSKINKRVEVVDIVEGLFKELINKDQSLNELKLSQLTYLVWSLCKVDLRNREIIAKISLEIEQK